MRDKRYDNEPRREILCIDMKSFYASIECVEHGWPPLTTMLVVMSNGENIGGLILASSPAAKERLGITNVMRKFDLPKHPDLKIVPPRMSLYLKKNMEIAEIIHRFVADDDFFCYSIDEFFIDITNSYHLFGKSTYEVAQLIKATILAESGLYCTIGIGDNPLLAKVALDIEAKHNEDFIATWRYEDVPETLWKISPMTEMWGIGRQTAKTLNKMGITSIYELAHTDQFRMKERLGIIGEQLWAHAWGIDRSRLADRYTPQEKSLNNSQILMRDYTKREDIEIVLREMTDQVAARLRKQHYQTKCIHLFVGFADKDSEGKRHFSRQMKIPTTNQSLELATYCLTLFNRHWQGQTVRHLGITYSSLVEHTDIQLNLFDESEKQLINHRLDSLVDTIRQKYGYTSLLHANSLLEGGTAVSRSNLVGGHAGGLEGLQ